MATPYKCQRIEPPFVKDDALVKVTETGDITHLRYLSFVPKGGQQVQKINDTEFVVLSTGEVKEYKPPAEKRTDNEATLRRTMAQFRDMLNTNVREDNRNNCKWVTLTYRPNEDGSLMEDEKQLYPDVKAFVKRLHYKYGSFEYLCACEPHNSGAWHIHMVLIFPGKAPFISNDDMAKVWQHGYTKTKKLPPSNIGAYLSAYLTDMQVGEDKNTAAEAQEALTAGGDGEDGSDSTAGNKAPQKASKAIIKGLRLMYYPAGFHPFRWSKGCKQPTEYSSTYQKEKDCLRAATQKAVYCHEIKTPTMQKALVVLDEYYNTKEPKSQQKTTK